MLGRHPKSHRRRSNFIRLERLESRDNPTTFQPSQILAAYGFSQLAKVDNTTLTGAGQTIAIVDAFGDPDIQNDLKSFDSTFGIPAPPSFNVVSQTGSTTSLPTNNTGWAGETSLDVEWSHAIAPGANILLVQANSNNFGDLLTAIDYARNQPGVSVVSMSFGGGESSGESSHFTTPSGHVGGVSFVASAGDTGAEVIYPSSDPNVLSVGGTSLTLSGGNYGSESAWSDSGGGPSTVFAKPSYQAGETVSGTMRGTPDVAYDADPGTGFYIYDTDGGSGLEGGVGGTSCGAPQWAGLIALVNQGRTLFDQSTLNGASQLLPAIYSMASDFNDVTTGSNGHPALTGYDEATGLGSPKAQLLIPALISYGNTNNVAPSVTSPPSSMTVNAGQTATFTAAASGTPTPTVQWEVSTNGGSTFTAISGATSASFTTAVTTPASNGYEYEAVFSNGAGSPATTNPATLTVDYAPTVTTQPASQSVALGQTATFTAAATGNPTPTVQWQVSTDGGLTYTNISGATSASYTTPAATLANNGYEYQAVFSNGVGSPAATNPATLTINTAPAITTQPADQTVAVGEAATFTAAASGSPAPTVQWQRSINGGPFLNLSGATSASYTTPAATAANNGYRYRANFTNGSGTATTNPATLTVGSAPSVTTQPTDATVNVGQTATFTAAASGSPTPTVQWQESVNGGPFTNINGATDPTFTFNPVATDNGDEFQAVFTNGIGTPATTNAATLTVDYAPTVTAQPINATVNFGRTATFTAAASGNPTPTVQWQVSTDGGLTFTNINGATSASYTTSAVTPANNGWEYQAVFTNGVGSPATTNVATLTVGSAPSVTTQPTGQTVTVGQTATFTAVAGGNPTPTVQWQESIDGGPFTNISGATSNTYAFNPALADNGDQFQAVFTNSVGSINSVIVPLTVVAPVTVGPIQVGDGTAQRSEVRSITVTFSGAVNFAGGNAAAAFQLTNIQDSANVILAATVSTNGAGQTVVVLTFSGAETDAESGENPQNLSPALLLSLADGRYTLTIASASITDANGAALDGTGTGTAGSGNYVSPTDTQGGGAGQLGLFRLFGDTNGDGVVDQTDLGQFRSAFNTSAGNPNYLAYLDADNSGTIDQTDLGQFRGRFNASIF